MKPVMCALTLGVCLAVASVTPSHSQSWVHLGLAGKTVNAIVVDPTDPNVIFAGTEDGLYRSPDGGKVWDMLEPGFLRGIEALRIKLYPLPAIYAMRTAGDSNDGVYCSTDGGDNWDCILALACGTSLMGYSGLYAGALDDSAGGGVYRTSDGGATWDTINQGLDNLDVQSLGALSGFGDSVNVDFAGTRNGIYRRASSDTAWAWAGPAVNASICDFSADGHLLVYAAWGNGSWSDGVYEAIYMGETWEVRHYRIYTRTVEANPMRWTSVYAGALDSGVFRSTDGGGTWQEMNQGLTNLDVIELSFCATDTTWLYAGTEGGGVFRYGLPEGVERATDQKAPMHGTRLDVNRPNPFRTFTAISYFLPAATSATLGIYDIKGSLVRTLGDNAQKPGYYTYYWDGTDKDGRMAAGGLYFYRLATGGCTLTRSMVLVH